MFSSFSPSILHICASSSACTLESAPFPALLPFPPYISLCLPFSGQTFLLIRESAGWRHRGVSSVLTLSIFLLPLYPLPPSLKEVEIHKRHDHVHVCCLRTRTCMYNKSGLQWCGWENMTALHWESGCKPAEGAVLYKAATAAPPHAVAYFLSY